MQKIIKPGFTILIILCALKAAASGAIISGYYPSLKEGDIVTLTATAYGDPNFPEFLKVYHTKIKNHAFRFVIPARNAPIKIFIIFSDKLDKLTGTNQYIRKKVQGFYLEKGDDIVITEYGGKVRYSGRGSAKFKVLQQIRGFEHDAFSPLGTSFIGNPLLNFHIADSLIQKQLAFLQAKKNLLSGHMYTIYKANLFGGWIGRNYMVRYVPDSARESVINELKTTYFRQPFDNKDREKIDDSPAIIYADRYASSIRLKYEFDSCYAANAAFSDHNYYRFLKKNYSGKLLERLVADMLFRDRVEPGDNSGLINDALTWVKNQDFRIVLSNLKSHRAPGAKAFEFSFSDDQGQMHTMDEFKGKIVFIDFWFTGCGNCIQVTPFIKHLEGYFQQKPVVFLSINIDNTKEEWLKSIQTGKYTTKLGTNLFSGGNGLNSPISKYYSVDAGPTLILIDQSGKIMATPLDPRDDNGKSLIAQIDGALRN